MKRKILYIINPKSGTSAKSELSDLIRSTTNPDNDDIEIIYTKGPKHALELSKEAAKNKVDIVAIAGGDGTLNEAACGLVHSSTSLAILPMGSGNGLARHLSIPMDIKDALKTIITGKQIWCDTFSVNGHIGIGTFGVGFDAHIAHLFSMSSKRGYSTYVKLVLKEFVNYKGIALNLKIDGAKCTVQPFLFTVANSSQFGNNAIIAPMAKISDGWLDLAFVKKFPLLVAPSLIYRLTNNTLNKSKYYSHSRCKEVFIENQGTIKAHIDGEPVEISGDLNIRIIPSSIKINVPSY